MLEASYILPVRRTAPMDEELVSYLKCLRTRLEVIVVDASPLEAFAANSARLPGLLHIAPASDVKGANGKVRGVLTGLRMVSHERVVVADDDVRYDAFSLERVLEALEAAEVVRPQNFFRPLPWHALWDTGRILMNRAMGGDWPGTLAFRRSFLTRNLGYEADCLFENLELVRTVRAAGGRELVARDIFVHRLPPLASHFVSQRVRQAYDEFARPLRLAWQLAMLPVAVWLAFRRPRLLPIASFGAIALAEIGRRRDDGAHYFPVAASLVAPLWLAERMTCAWLAVGSRVFLGGAHYHGGIIRRAATPQRVLASRFLLTEEAGSKKAMEPAPRESNTGREAGI